MDNPDPGQSAHEAGETSAHGPPPGEAPGWFEKRRNINIIFYLLCLICAALVAVDVAHLYHKHAHFSFEEFPAFHAGFGFLAYVGLVLTSTQLRKLLKRSEDYYD